MRSFRLLLFLPILAGATAQPRIDVREILGKVAEIYASPSQYEFTIHSTSMWPKGTESRSSGFFVHVAVRKPDRLRMQMSITGRKSGPGENPDDAVTVADGEYTWIYSPTLAQYTKRKDWGAASVISIEEQLFTRYRDAGKATHRARVLREETLESDGKSVGCYVVEIADEPKSEFLTWWIDENRYLVLREDLEHGPGRPGQPVTYRESAVYTVARMNEPLAAGLFVFTPPAGARLVEEFSK